MVLAACGGGGDSGSAASGTSTASAQYEGSNLAAAASDAAAIPSASVGPSSGTTNTAPADSTATPSTDSSTPSSTTPSAGSTTPSTGSTTPSSNTPATAAPAPYGQNAANYVLTFQDEFEASSLNKNVWMDHEWYDSNNSTVNYAVEGGSLKIWPHREADGSFKKRVINTDGKFYQTYGYFEIEAKLPIGKGTWPAFWLYNHDEADPFRPEIDIMEAYAGGGPASGWSDANLHPTTYAPTIWIGNPGDLGGTKMVEGLGDLSAGFHKYALKWEANKQTFYFDGKEVYSANVSMPRRMYILLDLLYGSASGQPDGSTPTGKTNSFEVKYVRAWQFKK